MRLLPLVILLLVPGYSSPPTLPASTGEGQKVVLLHGLIRTTNSMKRMGRALEAAGFEVCNLGYPSTKHDIRTLAEDYALPAIEACVGAGDEPIDFVTHSMGGIIVRQLAEGPLAHRMGRVVMLSPPNGGSEVVDHVGDWWLFKVINGPAGSQLGTDQDSVPRKLGPPSFELGIITGRRTINWINSIMIKGSDDGKVSVDNARLEGMSDFLVLPVSHPFIMKDRAAIRATVRFLQTGRFSAVSGA